MTATLKPRAPHVRSHDELRALAAAGNAELGSLTDHEATADEVLEWVARNFAIEAAAVASSMADATIPFMVAEHLPGVDVIFLDTGYHFTETIFTRHEVERTLDVRLIDVYPEQTVAAQNEEFGRDLFARDPGLCCRRRKVIPLQKTLAGYEVWFSGVRRDETESRASTPLVAFDERNGLVKVSPIAAWTEDDVAAYASTRDIVVNPLLSWGYPSIGCEPCTQPVAEGEDPRSGRWANFSKTECGLHI